VWLFKPETNRNSGRFSDLPVVMAYPSTGVDSIYDPTLIKHLKTCHIQSISGILAAQMIRNEQWYTDEGVSLDGAISQ
jgi:hypothetical protein